MSDKYVALLELARAHDEGDQAQELDAQRAPPSVRDQIRAISQRWPAGVREGELVAPARIESRARACERALGQPSRTREQWRAAGDAGVVLWASLHPRISDLLAARRRAGAKADYARLWPHLDAALWPAPEQMRLPQDQPVKARAAYLALSFNCGLPTQELSSALFEREGLWKAQPADPRWSRVRPLR